MWTGLLSLFNKTWKYSSQADCVVGSLLLVVGVVAITLALTSNAIFTSYKIHWCVGIVILYFIYITPPIKRMIGMRHELVVHVAVWGIISLVIFLAAFFYIYFSIVDEARRQAMDRILNLPPVIAAVVGAVIGWYVHQENGAKFHRTGNSFGLIMQTRTSPEYLQHARRYFHYMRPKGFIGEDDWAWQQDKEARKAVEFLRNRLTRGVLPAATAEDIREIA